jgi:hypothetical protein
MNFISLSILFWTYKNTRFERGGGCGKAELLTRFEHRCDVVGDEECGMGNRE